jgi:hypothetical protein
MTLVMDGVTELAMNLPELVQVPAERDLPPGVMETQRENLLAQIRLGGGEADLTAKVRCRLGSMLRWLLSLASAAVLVLAFAVAGGSGAHAKRGVESIAVAGATAVTAVVLVSTQRPVVSNVGGMRHSHLLVRILSG